MVTSFYYVSSIYVVSICVENSVAVVVSNTRNLSADHNMHISGPPSSHLRQRLTIWSIPQLVAPFGQWQPAEHASSELPGAPHSGYPCTAGYCGMHGVP